MPRLKGIWIKEVVEGDSLDNWCAEAFFDLNTGTLTRRRLNPAYQPSTAADRLRREWERAEEATE